MALHFDLSEVLALVALCIMIAPTLAGWVRLPGLIGFVLAGAVLGPYVLGLVPEGAVDGLGKIGLLYLMFLAGLEVDMAQFRKNRNGAILLGLLGFALPLAIGFAAAGSLYGFTVTAALLLGSIFASHTLVTLPDVREAGLSTGRAVTTTVGATIITDTLALIVLAVTTASGSSPTTVFVLVGLGLAALGVYCFLILPKVGRRFFRRTGQSRTLRFAFMLFAFASAGVLAELFGIEGLVGAFLAGLGVNGLAPRGGPLLERVDFFGEALFVPAFLIYVGTKLNPAVMIKPSTISMALVFMAILVSGKVLAAAITGRVLKFSWSEVGLVFGMTIPQAAATLAATLVGAQVGLFSDQVVNAVVFIVLASIVAGSLLTRLFAARVELPAQPRRPLGSSVLVGLPSATPSDLLVMVASSVAAVDGGLLMPIAVTTRDDGAIADAERIADEATKSAEALGADVEARVRFAESYAAAMLEAIVDRRASVLVTPLTTDPGIVGRLFGGELERIGRDSPIPVLAVRAGSERITKVVLALDTKPGNAAGRYDQQLAARAAKALSTHLELPLTVGGLNDEQIDALNLGEISERFYGKLPISSHPEVLTPGSILVVPASVVRRLGPFASEFARTHADVAVLVAAGPYRLRVSLGAGQASSYLGVSVGTGATVADVQEP
jgi:Kef-type K+ transport system membrane component KefB